MACSPVLPLRAQEALPHIGYAYPAGGQQGTTFQVTLGGQFLNEIGRVSFSGDGIEARVLETKPMIEAQINELRKKATELSRDKKNINALREAAKIQRKLVRYTSPDAKADSPSHRRNGDAGGEDPTERGAGSARNAGGNDSWGVQSAPLLRGSMARVLRGRAGVGFGSE